MELRSVRTCIVLICDYNYLLYTLVSAQQAREHSPPDIDVRIFLDAPPDMAEKAARAAELTGLSISLVPQHLIEEVAAVPDHARVDRESHLSRSALLRLKIADLVADAYDRVLYLDGDVQVRRDLSDLFDIALPEGMFLAVRDWKAHQSFEGMPESADERRKLAALGLPEAKWSRYFNSGVMMADVSTWREIGPLALAYYSAHPEHCHTYDQCALNAVASDRVVPISPRWNYLRSLMSLPLYAEIDPAIVHFAAPPKPWTGDLPPWGREGYAPYVEMHRKLEALHLPWQRLSWWRKLKWSIKWWLKPQFADRDYRARMQALLCQDEV